MQPVTMYGVYDDGVDGRAPGKLCSLWEKERTAQERAGAYRSVRPVYVIPDNESERSSSCYYILERPDPVRLGVDFDEERKRLREQALAKLDPAERRALGL